MMKKLEKISIWDVPTTKQVPDGYEFKTIPESSDANIAFLIEKHNHLIEVVSVLCERLGIVFEEEN
jgi:hypothetical protein